MASQISDSGKTPRSDAVAQEPPPGIRGSLQQTLFSQPIQITVKRATIETRLKFSARLIGCEEGFGISKDQEHRQFSHGNFKTTLSANVQTFFAVSIC
jgi:hypothetical protein